MNDMTPMPSLPAGELSRPSQILCFLLDTLHECLIAAREAVASGQIERRFQAIKNATDVIGDLAAGLDPTATDEWSQQTGRLYRALTLRLLDANVQNSATPIEEALLLMSPLRHAWHTFDAQEALKAACFSDVPGAKDSLATAAAGVLTAAH
jgi:flagellar secretion chaperone FliS